MDENRELSEALTLYEPIAAGFTGRDLIALTGAAIGTYIGASRPFAGPLQSVLGAFIGIALPLVGIQAYETYQKFK